MKKAGKAIRMAVQFRSFRRGLLRYAARHNSTGSIPGRNAKLRSGVAPFHYTLRAMPLVPFPLRSGTRHSMPRNHFSIPISRRDAALHAATRLFIPIPHAPLHGPQPTFAPIAHTRLTPSGRSLVSPSSSHTRDFSYAAVVHWHYTMPLVHPFSK